MAAHSSTVEYVVQVPHSTHADAGNDAVVGKSIIRPLGGQICTGKPAVPSDML